MEKTINQWFVKLSSRVQYPKSMELGDDVTVIIGEENYLFNVVKSEDRDLQDGTIDRIYTLKSLSE